MTQSAGGGRAVATKRVFSSPKGGPVRRVFVVSDNRAVEGGSVRPVYYVQDSELLINSGPYILEGNKPEPIVESSHTIVSGDKAMAVYVMNGKPDDVVPPEEQPQIPLLELQADTGVTTSTDAFSGTGMITQSGTTVSGVGTLFQSEVVVGDRIQAVGVDGIVQSIATDTSLTLDTSATVGAGVVYTITPQAGTARVTTWLDQSGNGNHFTQAGTARPSKQTISGYPTIVFDGADDWLLGPDFADNLSSFTVFAVCRANPSSEGTLIVGKVVVSFLHDTYWAMTDVGGNFVIQQDAENGFSVFSTLNPFDNIFRVFTGELISVSVPVAHVYINGDNSGETLSIVGTVTTFSNTHPVSLARSVPFDGGNFLWGDMRAVLIYSPALSAAARAAKEQELADRYGITL